MKRVHLLAVAVVVVVGAVLVRVRVVVTLLLQIRVVHSQMCARVGKDHPAKTFKG